MYDAALDWHCPHRYRWAGLFWGTVHVTGLLGEKRMSKKGQPFVGGVDSCGEPGLSHFAICAARSACHLTCLLCVASAVCGGLWRTPASPSTTAALTLSSPMAGGSYRCSPFPVSKTHLAGMSTIHARPISGPVTGIIWYSSPFLHQVLAGLFIWLPERAQPLPTTVSVREPC